VLTLSNQCAILPLVGGSRLAAAIVLLIVGAILGVAASGAATRPKALRIVAAAVLDVDRDSRADQVRLTYSRRIRHSLDRDGRYPFTVVGYRIRSVGAASGRMIVLSIAEKAAPDQTAKPGIRYRRTLSKPVKDLFGNQAIAQAYARTRAHGHAPAAPPPPPALSDRDGDGTPDGADCAPDDRNVHPGAADEPDLAFLDSNCDAVDGTTTKAIFVSPLGKDTNPGTKGSPKRQIDAAVAAASAKGVYVLAAAGTYARVDAATGVNIFGGYDGGDWSRRSATLTTLIAGAPEGLRASNVRNIVLQQLSIRGNNAGASAYGIRAVNGASLKLQRVTVTGGDGAAGDPGANGAVGGDGDAGQAGQTGNCDGSIVGDSNNGGAGGDSPQGRHGGRGGEGGDDGTSGKSGSLGLFGIPAGAGGKASAPGGDGGNGQNGTNGAAGGRAGGGSSSTARAGATWLGANGGFGSPGAPGNGGGGGGGGGGQTGVFVIDGDGNGGGGGGGGGAGGRSGDGGGFGGGSFGIYLFNSTVVVESGSVSTGNGGSGGRGGNGGGGGRGGTGGLGADECIAEAGEGGNGGRGGTGGTGGGGGGGAGGPSIGVMKVGTSAATLTGPQIAVGTRGSAGLSGAGGSGSATPAQAGLEQAIYPG
jgi:hypothetical protein